MIRRFFIVLLLGASAAYGQRPDNVQLKADVTEIAKTGEVINRGNVRLRDGEALLTTDELRENSRTHEAIASGHVVLTRGALRLLADRLIYREDTGAFSAERVRVGSFPYYAEGDTAVGSRSEITVANARVTYGEPGPWQPTLIASSVTFAPGQRLRSEHSFIGVGHLQPLPFPKFQQDLKAALIPYVSLTGGYRSSLGVFGEAGLHVPVADSVRLGGDLGIYTARGILFGPSGTYANPDDPALLSGEFHSGYINDHGDKKTDILGQPIPEDRAFVEWNHRQQLAENLSLTAQVKWWSDSEVVRDFRPRAFFPVQEPDTFVESVYAGQNFFVSAFARLQPNSFEHVQERLPEIRFDLLPAALPGGFVTQFNASYVRLRERGPFLLSTTPGPAPALIFDGNATFAQADRLDAYYGLSRPLAWQDWFSFTPVGGARLQHYANALFTPAIGTVPLPTGPTFSAGQSQTRTLGEAGFDAVLRSSGTFDYKNEIWKIDGLRHLFTPRLSYRYIKADKAAAMPAIDRPVFSTYLQPLGLSDTRAIDTLNGTNTLRLALENVLQTRDPTYGSRDLASFTIANDFGFKPGQRDLSGPQIEAALMPTSWLQFDTYQRYTPRQLTLNEFNTGFTLHDGRAWSVRFANNFLRHQLDDYALEAHARLNEAFEVLSRLNYDVRKRRFNEQAYGLTQNLGNTWLVSYVVSLYSGPRRESHFGVSVQVDTVRF